MHLIGHFFICLFCVIYVIHVPLSVLTHSFDYKT